MQDFHIIWIKYDQMDCHPPRTIDPMFIKHVLKKVVFRHPLYLAECMLVVGG